MLLLVYSLLSRGYITNWIHEVSRSSAAEDDKHESHFFHRFRDSHRFAMCCFDLILGKKPCLTTTHDHNFFWGAYVEQRYLIFHHVKKYKVSLLVMDLRFAQPPNIQVTNLFHRSLGRHFHREVQRFARS